MSGEVTTQLILLFFLMSIGFLAYKTGFIDKQGSDKLSAFITNVTMPCMYIATFMQAFSAERMIQGLTQLGFSLVYYLIVLAVSVLFITAVRAPKRDRGVYQFLIIFSNAAFMGYPVLQAVFGNAEGDPLFFGVFFNIPFNLLAFTLGVWLLTRDREGGKARSDFRMYVNPATVSIFIGLLLFFISPLVPQPVYGVVYEGFVKTGFSMLGNTTVPLSMVVIGTVLATIKPANIFGNPRVFALAAVRLLAVPALLLLCLAPFGFPRLEAGVPVVIAGMPSAVFCVILAKQYGGDEELASVGVFITTLLSFASIPLLTWAINTFLA